MSLDLGVLHVSLEAETNAFMKQFAGAAKQVDAFAAQMKRASAQVAQVSTVLSGVGAAAIALASTVDGPTKNAMEGLKKNTELLAVQVADALIPAIKELSKIVHDAAQWFANLSPELKGHISHFAVLAVQIGVAAKAFSLIAGLISSAAGAISAVASAIGSIGIGPLLGIVVAIGLIVAAVVLWHKAWREHSDAIKSLVKDAAEYLGNAFGEAFKFIGDLVSKSLRLFQSWILGVLNAVDALQKLSGIKLVDVGGLREGVNGLFADLRSGEFFKVALKFGKDVGGQIVDGFTDEMGRIKKELMGALGLDGKGNGQLIGLGRGAAKQRMSYQDLVAAGMLGPEGLRDRNQSYNPNGAGPLAYGATQDGVQRHISQTSAVGGNRILPPGTEAAIAQEVELGQHLTGISKVLFDAQKALAPVGAALSRALSSVLNGLSFAGRSLANKLGELGNVINAAMAGFESGGIWGALIAAVVEMLSASESFIKVVNTSNGSMASILKSFEPIAKSLSDAISVLIGALSPVIDGVINILTPILDGVASVLTDFAPILWLVGTLLKGIAPLFQSVSHALKALWPVFALLFYVIKYVMLAILGIVWLALQIWNGVIEAIARVVESIIFWDGGNAANEIRKVKADMKPTEDAMADLNSSTFDGVKAANARTAADFEAAGAAQGMADAATSVTEALTNVPSGFKVARARFDATAIDGGGSPMSMALSEHNNAPAVQITGPVTVRANDPEELITQLEHHIYRRNFRETGNPAGRWDP
jgi:phage-related protein